MIGRIQPFSPPAMPPDLGRDFRTFRDNISMWLRQYDQSVRDYLTRVTEAVNNQHQGFGETLASASTLEPSSFMHRVTGTDTVTTIGVPPDFPGQTIVLQSVDGFALGTGGNIAQAKSLRAGQTAMLTYNPDDSLWYEVATVEDLQDVPDNASVSRHAVREIDPNRRALIDFQRSEHVDKQLDNIPDGTTHGRVLNTGLLSNRVNTSIGSRWDASTAYALGDIIQPSGADANGNFIYEVTTAGTSGTSEPTWPVTPVGATVADGTVVWTLRRFSSDIGAGVISSGTSLQTTGTLTVNSSNWTSAGTLVLDTPTDQDLVIFFIVELQDNNGAFGDEWAAEIDDVTATRLWHAGNFRMGPLERITSATHEGAITFFSLPSAGTFGSATTTFELFLWQQSGSPRDVNLVFMRGMVLLK